MPIKLGINPYNVSLASYCDTYCIMWQLKYTLVSFTRSTQIAMVVMVPNKSQQHLPEKADTVLCDVDTDPCTIGMRWISAIHTTCTVHVLVSSNMYVMLLCTCTCFKTLHVDMCAFRVKNSLVRTNMKCDPDYRYITEHNLWFLHNCGPIMITLISWSGSTKHTTQTKVRLQCGTTIN